MGIYLVTGGGGFIGANLIIALLELGHEVRVLDNFSTGSLDNLQPVLKEIDLRRGDLRDMDDVRRAAAGVEVVFHQAALSSVPGSVANPLAAHEINCTGTLNVFWAALSAGVRRVVYASSSSVYGNSEALPKTESMEPCPASPYAVAKLAGEIYGQVFYRLYGLETVGLRYFNVFGPRQNPESEYAAVIPRFIVALLNRKQPVIYGDGEQSRDFIYIDDVIRANLLACRSEGAAGHIFNIAAGTKTSLNELLGILKDITGVQVDAFYAASRPGDVRQSTASIDKAAALLGYSPQTGLEAGLKLTVAWFARTI